MHSVNFLANNLSLEEISGVSSFSICHRNYKKCIQTEKMDLCGHSMKQCFQTNEFIFPEPVKEIRQIESEPVVFTEEENQINLRRCQKKKFYHAKECRYLCSTTIVLESTRHKPYSPCESICFELTESSLSAGEICPWEKRCVTGCPCPFYKCEKITKPIQKLTPYFNLKKSESVDSFSFSHYSYWYLGLITRRWSDRWNTEMRKFPIILSDLTGNQDPVKVKSDFLLPYGCFEILYLMLC